jgi:hypothetical protein
VRPPFAFFDLKPGRSFDSVLFAPPPPPQATPQTPQMPHASTEGAEGGAPTPATGARAGASSRSTTTAVDDVVLKSVEMAISTKQRPLTHSSQPMAAEASPPKPAPPPAE